MSRRWAVGLWLFCFTIPAARAQVFPVDTVLLNDSTDERINLVFLAEGYTAAEMAVFASDVQVALNGILNTPPYQQYAAFFNAFAIELPSNESGTDHPGTAADEPGGLAVFFKDTYFNSTFDGGNTHRALVANSQIVFDVLGDNFPQWDAAFIVVNTDWYGGTGGSYSTFSTHSSAAEIAIHELGHSFAKLADEYDYGGSPGSERPNATAQTDRDLIRWKIWIEDTTPIPTPETGTYSAVVGLFEGAVYNPTGWYRPKLKCKMQSLGIPFCEVCTEQTILKTYNLISPIASVMPDTTQVEVDWNATTTLSVQPMPVSPQTTRAEWMVDSVSVASGSNTFVFDGSAFEPGDHWLEVVLSDTTSRVRKDSFNLLVASRGWTVTVQPPPYIIGDPNFDGQVTSADVIFMVNHVFKSGPPPSPYQIAGDLDCSATLTSSDIVLLVSFIFKSGPEPPLDCP